MERERQRHLLFILCQNNKCQKRCRDHLDSSLNIADLSGSEATPYRHPSPISVVTTGSAAGLHATSDGV